MKIEQCHWTADGGWEGALGAILADSVHLVLVFGGTEVLRDPALYHEVRAAYPGAHLLGCSTAGEICGERVFDDSLVVTAIHFDATEVAVHRAPVDEAGGSRQAGEAVAAAIKREGLRHVLVLSDGQQVNGSELVRGMLAKLPMGVQVTGGLAGDGSRFESTLVFADEPPREGNVVALGLYGESLKVGFGSLGGWDPFGPERLITQSEGNVLYELDGKPALELYKTYLGEHASGLPATGLLFPLSIQRSAEGDTLVRTILAVDEKAKSLTFAGDVPTGARAQLMKANFERLIDGAIDAARASLDTVGGSSPELAILISCVGRKLLLGQRTEEEVEGVREVLGPRTTLSGFYSYGEISPITPEASCQLHNQTMTITTLAES
jgi:hypothetical protein